MSPITKTAPTESKKLPLWQILSNMKGMLFIVRWMRLASIIIIMAGCASVPPSEEAAVITPEQLLAGEPLLAGIDELPEIIAATDVLALNPEMRSFVDSYVDRGSTSYAKLHQLLYAVINEGGFGLKYNDLTHTAAETFNKRNGNCLSFTNMFVAMARDAGLKVSFQEVDIPPDWTMQGDIYVLSRHMNIYVDLGYHGEHIVDFNIDDFRSTYDRRRVSDDRALAHFYSNQGVERLQAGDEVEAFLFFRQAIEFDQSFAAAWNNLGALYNRGGHRDFAEASYLQAVEVQRGGLLSMSNLARLYEEKGDQERAEYYRDRVRYHRSRNPYYQYHLAREAFQERNYEQAIEYLQRAIRQKEWEDSFYFLLGLSYLQMGEEEKARRWLSKAEEVAEGDALKRNYHNKLELLLSASPEQRSDR
jgi:Flp pilus assembly protein TadD